MTTEQTRARTYGNWTKPAVGGLLGLDLIPTIIGMAGLIVAAVSTMFFGWVPAVALIVLLVVILGPLAYRDSNDRTMWLNAATAMHFVIDTRNQSNLYRSGPLTPVDSYLLPGLLGKTKVSEWNDALGRPFAMLSWPRNLHTIVLACNPDGSTNVDQENIDQSVAYWGQWLTMHSHVTGMVAASVVVETSPDTGQRLLHEVNANKSEWAPKLAQDVMEEIVATYPAGSAQVRAWITMTFTETGRVTLRMRGRDKRTEAMAVSLSSEMPALTASLPHSGAGPVEPMDVQDLCEVVRAAYDPDAAKVLEQVHATGERVQALTWKDVGPAATQASWGHYHHDGGVSVTTIMTAPPRGDVPERILSRLLSPTSGVVSKRVAIHYKPLHIAKAGKVVEKDHANAEFAKNVAPKPTAKLIKNAKAAEATATEEAHGAGLTDFAIASTVTFANVEQVPDMTLVLENLNSTARLSTRVAYGWQEGAFALTLPVGLVPEMHLSGPKFMKENA